MVSIKDFVEAEKNKMSWLDKVILNYPEAYSTSFLSTPIKQNKPEVVIRPSVFQKLITIPFFFFALIAYIPLTNILIKKSLPIIIPLTGILFVSFIIYLLIWNSFINSKYIYRIKINNEFIEAKGNKFYWKELSETCILSKMEGRYSNSYLVLLLQDGKIEKLNLFKFAIHDKKLAGIIEFYKEQSKSL